MKQTKTLTGVELEYEGSINDGLVIHKNILIKISKNIINAIKSEITSRSPVLMGAHRDNPSKNSIGESLKKQGYSPQNLSYVIPLLIEEGFCAANEKKPFVITKK
jgi:hypothetical protein